MTKFLLSLTAVSLCLAGNAIARQNHINVKPAQARAAGASTNANKTTGTESRLIASSTYTYNNGSLDIQDSAHLNYSPNRGFEYELDQWKFDNAMGWSGNPLDDDYRIAQTFDAKNHIATYFFEQYDGSQWVPEEYDTYTYTAMGKLATSKSGYFDGTTWDSSRQTNTYNSRGAMLESVSESWRGSGWENSYKNIYVVDANDLVLLDYSLYWNNNLSKWDTGSRTTHTYNASKLPTEVLNESYNAGSWMNSYRTIYQYDNNGNVTSTESQSWSSGNNKWENNSKTLDTYDAGNNKVTSIYMVFKNVSYENLHKTEYAYNSYHQITLESRKSWNASTGQFELTNGDYDTHNYYETFTNSVKAVAGGSNMLKVYPVPAGDVMNVRFNGNSSAGSVYLYDNTGKMVKHVPTVAGSTITTVDTHDLPAGSYFLKAVSGGNTVTKQVSIVK